MNNSQEKMSVLKPEERIKNFQEIEKCFTKEQALKEAERCIQCINPLCIKGCPAKVNCKEFIRRIKEQDFQGALETILEENPLPGYTCRGCNAEAQCEQNCILARKDSAIAIRALERFAVENAEQKKIDFKETGKKVAIIGAGPTGMAAAIEFEKKGIKARIFEMTKEIGGMVNTIPEYRIPKQVTEKQAEWIQGNGITIEKKSKIGEEKALGVLLKDFDAVLIASGESNAKQLKMKGNGVSGVVSWLEFLKKHGHGNGEKVSEKKCIVVGGGDTAMDCARTALRMGYETKIVYRKNLEFMPCRKKEYREAIEEGVEFKYLLTPAEFKGKKQLEKIKFQKVEIKKEEFVAKKEFVEFEAALGIMAIGQEFDESVFKGSIMQGKPLKEETNRTELTGVFIAGDSVNKQKTIVHAIQSAKNAVKQVQLFFEKGPGKEAGYSPFDMLLGA